MYSKKNKIIIAIGILFIGCGPHIPVTAIRIAMASGRVLNLLQTVKTISNNTTDNIDYAFTDLNIRIKNSRLSSTSVTEMENIANHLNAQSKAIKDTIKQIEIEAGGLFKMLYEKANENKTDDLKSIMLENIEAKEDVFDQKIEAAFVIQKKLEVSIQKYNDIIGFVQVQGGLDEIDKYISTIDVIISESTTLNSEIQIAIDQGIDIINEINPKIEDN